MRDLTEPSTEAAVFRQLEIVAVNRESFTALTGIDQNRFPG